MTKAPPLIVFIRGLLYIVIGNSFKLLRRWLGLVFCHLYSLLAVKGERSMVTKRILQLIVVVSILVASFASAGGVMAWGGCASYITVQWGDTLSGLARLCGTTVEAIQSANPGLGWWVYAGQVLYIPTGYASAPANNYTPTYGGGTYVVQRGDTVGKIAARQGVSVGDILAANPQIWNASLIYVGQVINLPAAAPVYYTVNYGDTLRIIANNYGTSVYSLQVLNPTIYNANLIYPGQVIRVW
jgi:LysM repeat protein